ncbi:MAG: AraC family transcriptional regulator [Anaerolineae bacterium]|nr:AraC family transcriptional regulator [Anaerolineae bacterium]MCB9108535.1 AraC family transcriptional regulator [Anaerolineales bacterium]
MAYRTDKLRKLAALVEQHTVQEGVSYTGIESLGTFKAASTRMRMPDYYEPAIVMVAQGKKRCYIGNQTYEYGAGDYLILFLPMSLDVEIVNASPDHPFLAAGVRIDLGRLADVLLRIERVEGGVTKPVSTDPSGIFSASLSDNLLDPTIRLLESLANPRDAAILGDLIVDEIYYRILCDERGGDLRTFLQQRGQIQRVAKAVQYIHQNLKEPVSVEKLADMVHMSRTSFYENFKEVMHVSPLQYAKSVKLVKAQTLIKEGKNASEAGYLVGYNSPAQFSREYKRHFGFVPSAT